MLLFLAVVFAFVAPVQASSVTINLQTVEVIQTGFTKRTFAKLGDMRIVYRTSNEAFELQSAETLEKLWGGDIDSVTISGASTAAQKLAFLRTCMLEATTTNGYRVFMGRNDLQFFFTAATNRMDVKWGSNKQPLWFGHIDSLQIGALSGASAKLAYTRLVNRWRSQDLLPNTSAATIAAGAAAGSSPTVTVAGDAFSGKVTVVIGASGATTGVLATITTKVTAPTGYRVVLTPRDDNASAHFIRIKVTDSATTWVLNVHTTALTTGGTYTWDYVATPY